MKIILWHKPNSIYEKTKEGRTIKIQNKFRNSRKNVANCQGAFNLLYKGFYSFSSKSCGDRVVVLLNTEIQPQYGFVEGTNQNVIQNFVSPVLGILLRFLII
jgi:hypothetical protein